MYNKNTDDIEKKYAIIQIYKQCNSEIEKG